MAFGVDLEPEARFMEGRSRRSNHRPPPPEPPETRPYGRPPLQLSTHRAATKPLHFLDQRQRYVAPASRCATAECGMYHIGGVVGELRVSRLHR
jgi:hypothetical protein